MEKAVEPEVAVGLALPVVVRPQGRAEVVVVRSAVTVVVAPAWLRQSALDLLSP